MVAYLTIGAWAALRHNEGIMQKASKVTKIGLFIDGGYFSHVSTYYRYHHPGGNFMSVKGVKDFVRHRIAQLEEESLKRCRVVESHYYRGRFPARDARDRSLLFAERVFDDGLLYAGVETHYRPTSKGKERGIDVLLALDAYKMATTQSLDVIVLFAGDGDFIPLVRKLHGFGTRVMVLGFNLQATGADGEVLATRCSFHLLEEASYPVVLSEEIDAHAPGSEPLLDALFLPKTEAQDGQAVGKWIPASEEDALTAPSAPTVKKEKEGGDENVMRWSGHVCYLEHPYGFLLREGDNKRFFFHESDLSDVKFAELRDGNGVSFVASSNERGPYARNIYMGTKPKA